MKINVQYPTHERVNVIPAAEAIAKYGHTIERSEYPNRPVSIEVKTNAPQQSNEELCMELTGMTPQDYQNKFGQAWNE